MVKAPMGTASSSARSFRAGRCPPWLVNGLGGWARRRVAKPSIKAARVRRGAMVFRCGFSRVWRDSSQDSVSALVEHVAAG